MPRHLRMTVTKGVIIRQRRTDEEKQGIESGARCKGHQDHALLLCSTFANRANTHECDEKRQEAIAIALKTVGQVPRHENQVAAPGRKRYGVNVGDRNAFKREMIKREGDERKRK